MIAPNYLKSLRPKKHLGQNFLIDKKILHTILQAAELKKDDYILEIGPGLGTLTNALAEKVAKVKAIEKDPDLIPKLRKACSAFPNIEIIPADGLRIALPPSNYKVVANIPYYITSPLINHFIKNPILESKRRPKAELKGKIPELMVLMVQKEVAEKICANKKNLNVLALNIQTFAAAEIIAAVPRECFHPIPQVDSAIIRIRPLKNPSLPQDLKKYFNIINLCFSQKRKKISNSLKKYFDLGSEATRELLLKYQINPDLRPQQLSLKDWQKICKLK